MMMIISMGRSKERSLQSQNIEEKTKLKSTNRNEKTEISHNCMFYVLCVRVSKSQCRVFVFFFYCRKMCKQK